MTTFQAIVVAVVQYAVVIGPIVFVLERRRRAYLKSPGDSK